MSIIAIDTNAYRALDDGVAGAAKQVVDAHRIGMPIIVLGELYHGVEKGNKRRRNLERLKAFMGSPRVEILHITEETARIFGEISTELALAGKPIQQNDIWIAALCKQYYFPLLTADKGFEHIIGLDVMTFDTAPR